MELDKLNGLTVRGDLYYVVRWPDGSPRAVFMGEDDASRFLLAREALEAMQAGYRPIKLADGYGVCNANSVVLWMNNKPIVAADPFTVCVIAWRGLESGEQA